MSRSVGRLGPVGALGFVVAACSTGGSPNLATTDSTTATTTATTTTATATTSTSTTTTIPALSGDSGISVGLFLAVVAIAVALAIALVFSRRASSPSGQLRRPGQPQTNREQELERELERVRERVRELERELERNQAGKRVQRFPPTIGEPQPSADAEPNLQGSATAPADLLLHAGQVERKGGRALVVRAASLRGTASRLEGKERQDAYSFVARGNYLVFAVADGVGSLPHSGIAARVASRNACTRVREVLDSTSELSDDAIRRLFENGAWDIVLAARQHADNKELSAKDAARSMATTLVVGVLDHQPRRDPQLTVARVGDSSAWLLRGGRAQSFYGNDAGGGALVDTKTVALPGFGEEGVEIVRRTVAPNDVVILATDGFANGWGDGVGDVVNFFGTEWASPPEPITFAGHVGYRRRSFDDDRTVIAVWV